MGRHLTDGGKARRNAMNAYEFTLKFQLADPQADADRYTDELYGNGCEDAVIGVGRKGTIALQFIREAESANAAIVSAIADVRKTIPDAKVIESSPDFGASRGWLPAVNEGAAALWHWADGCLTGSDIMSLPR
jgi:hypothetical protein